MKSFLFKLSGFIAILGIILFLALLANRTFSDFKLPEDSRLLVIGDSHPECAFNDSMINGLVNRAQSGEAYFYTYFKVKQLIEQNPQIKHVFIEFANNQVGGQADNWIWGTKFMSNRFPKYGVFMDLASLDVLFTNNPSTFITSFVPLLKSTLSKFSEGLRYRSEDIGGYNYLKRDKTDSLLSTVSLTGFSSPNTAVSATNLSYLRKTIEYCKQQSIDVFLIRSPRHSASTEITNEPTFQQVRQAQFADVVFLDCKDFPLSNKEFGDLEHLNYRGAARFSAWFKQLLEKGLLQHPDKAAFLVTELQLLPTATQ